MKKNIYIIVILILSVLNFSCVETVKNENVLDYFIDTKLEKINYRTFKNSNSSFPNVIFEQRISTNEIDSKNIKMDYVFMDIDSLVLYGGTENIENNKIEVLKQYIFINNKKIRANKIKNRVWIPNSDTSQSITIEFYDKESDYKIITNSETFSRFKDTLGKQSFIVELNTNINTFLNSKKTQEVQSKSKRLYVKNKGLVYFDELINGLHNSYHLIE